MLRGIRWSLFALLVAGLSWLVGACSSSSDAGGGSSGEAALPPGARAYGTNCAGCHGADGSGGQAPAIGAGLAAAKYDQAALENIIRNGKGAMPALGGGLSADEVGDIAAFVRGSLGTTPTTTTTTAADEADGGDGERGALRGAPPELEVAGGWPVANGDLLASRTVTSSGIDSDSVDDLQLAWTYEAPGGGTFGNLTTNPLVVGDRVYLGDLTTRVRAIDRETGEEVFVVGDDASIFGPTGVGVGWDRLYGTKANGEGRGSVVVAYDAETGDELWATDVGRNGGDVNFQPVAYDGLVFAATSGYGAGTRGTIYALDAETGSIVWDFVVVEDPDVWGNPDLNSGGGVWYPPTIDTERNIAYFGTGNPYPFPGADGFPNGWSRPGDNRWTDSTLALDIETGELAWGFQAIEHDIFDRDAMLTTRVDVEVDGEERALTIGTGKLGVVHALDADTGEVVWKTEVGTHLNDELTEIDGPTLVYPGSLGGVQTPMAVASDTIYLCVMNAPTEYEGPEQTSFGFGVELGTANSQLIAIDAATGAIDWQVELPGDSFGGATVVNDLVFTSSFGGEILALSRTDGQVVWRYQADGGINGWPAVAGDELYVPVGMADPPHLLAFRLED